MTSYCGPYIKIKLQKVESLAQIWACTCNPEETQSRHIKFCPDCGTKLKYIEDKIQRYPGFFEILEDKYHNNLISIEGDFNNKEDEEFLISNLSSDYHEYLYDINIHFIESSLKEFKTNHKNEINELKEKCLDVDIKFGFFKDYY
jgi:hypothetical protein